MENKLNETDERFMMFYKYLKNSYVSKKFLYFSLNYLFFFISEGGRLQEELRYVEDTLGAGAGATNELIIQTPAEDQEYTFGNSKNSLSTVLSSEALLLHLEVLKNASKVVVEKEDVTWKLKDLCYAPTIPLTEINMIDGVS